MKTKQRLRDLEARIHRVEVATGIATSLTAEDTRPEVLAIMHDRPDEIWDRDIVRNRQSRENIRIDRVLFRLKVPGDGYLTYAEVTRGMGSVPPAAIRAGDAIRVVHREARPAYAQDGPLG